MKILILNGSPKREQSDTLHLTRAFITGMCDVGEQQVETMHVIDRNINYCTGCFSCMRNGGVCIHSDDMREILEQILESDLLIFSFPLYCYGMPASLKALMDRTLPLSSMAMEFIGDRYHHVAQRDFSKLKYLMICGCGFPNSENNFEAMTLQFKLMFPNHSTVLTVSESPMFNVREAESVTAPFLEEVRQAGREYALDGVISEETMKALRKPMIPPEIYARIANGEVQP